MRTHGGKGLMEIAMIIVGGLVLMTIFASGFDYLSKRRKGVDNVVKLKVEELENRVRLLEQNLGDRNEKVAQLESDIIFLNKLLEKK
jgi:hypothetical protein